MLGLSRLADAASDAAPEAAAISAVDPIARRPLHAAAIDRLREAIVRGELAPGTRLNERVLATQLGISRTPLREAFKLLANEGLAELLPNRGAIVTPIHAERIAQTLRVMGALEALVGELACQHASDSEIANIRALHFEMRAAHARGDGRGGSRGLHPPPATFCRAGNRGGKTCPDPDQSDDHSHSSAAPPGADSRSQRNAAGRKSCPL